MMMVSALQSACDVQPIHTCIYMYNGTGVSNLLSKAVTLHM